MYTVFSVLETCKKEEFQRADPTWQIAWLMVHCAGANYDKEDLLIKQGISLWEKEHRSLNSEELLTAVNTLKDMKRLNYAGFILFHPECKLASKESK